jgi:hypothetical protein
MLQVYEVFHPLHLPDHLLEGLIQLSLESLQPQKRLEGLLTSVQRPFQGLPEAR